MRKYVIQSDSSYILDEKFNHGDIRYAVTFDSEDEAIAYIENSQFIKGGVNEYYFKIVLVFMPNFDEVKKLIESELAAAIDMVEAQKLIDAEKNP